MCRLACRRELQRFRKSAFACLRDRRRVLGRVFRDGPLFSMQIVCGGYARAPRSRNPTDAEIQIMRHGMQIRRPHKNTALMGRDRRLDSSRSECTRCRDKRLSYVDFVRRPFPRGCAKVIQLKRRRIGWRTNFCHESIMSSSSFLSPR